MTSDTEWQVLRGDADRRAAKLRTRRAAPLRSASRAPHATATAPRWRTAAHSLTQSLAAFLSSLIPKPTDTRKLARWARVSLLIQHLRSVLWLSAAYPSRRRQRQRHSQQASRSARAAYHLCTRTLREVGAVAGRAARASAQLAERLDTPRAARTIAPRRATHSSHSIRSDPIAIVIATLVCVDLLSNELRADPLGAARSGHRIATGFTCSCRPVDLSSTSRALRRASDKLPA